MSKEQENLNELLSSFYNEQEANEFKKNLDSFDAMLSECPTPSAQMINDIKCAVVQKLSTRKHSISVISRRMAMAAMIMLIAFAGLKMSNRQNEIKPKNVLTADFFEDDETSQIALLTEEIEQIEDALLSVRLDEYDTFSGDSYFELETELSEINGDFWKG